jgi:hypothetical protein
VIYALDSSGIRSGTPFVTAPAFGVALSAGDICSIYSVESEFWLGEVPGTKNFQITCGLVDVNRTRIQPGQPQNLTQGDR